MLMGMYSTLLGEPFGWASQQNGALVNDVLPIRGHEQQQISSNSESELTWHTEDAWSDSRADYVVLLCIRNPDGVGTSVASIDAIDRRTIDPALWDTLFQPKYLFRIDPSHSAGLDVHRAAAGGVPTHASPGPILFGDRSSPYLRFDPTFTAVADNDVDAWMAMSALASALERSKTEIPLDPGDVLILDNYRVVHSRRPFTARFDGTDRWLKRVNVARDFRRAVGYGSADASRVVRP
jgi:Fe(II)/alpha-ketoglutarate-dependent arginine beta-hydroxylase